MEDGLKSTPDPTDDYVIAGRPGERENVKVPRRRKSRPKRRKREKTPIVDRLDKQINAYSGRLNYDATPTDLTYLDAINARVGKYFSRAELGRWADVQAFLKYIHCCMVPLDLLGLAVLNEDELVVEVRRMLFNFDSELFLFRPRFTLRFRQGGRKKKARRW